MFESLCLREINNNFPNLYLSSYGGFVGYASVDMNNLYIDQTIGHVKKIVENIQCAIW